VKHNPSSVLYLIPVLAGYILDKLAENKKHLSSFISLSVNENPFFK